MNELNELDTIINEFNDKVSFVQTIMDVKTLEETFGSIQHPFICYTFGQLWNHFKNKEKAFMYFLNGVSISSFPENPWLKLGYIDPVGQCNYYLSVFDFKESFNDIKIKLIGNAYYCFSLAIRLIGTDAYDSCNSRAKLFFNAKNDNVKLTFLEQNGFTTDEILIDLLSFIDLKYSLVGYKKMNELKNINEVSEKLSLKETQLIEKLKINEVSIDKLDDIAKKLHAGLFQNVRLNYINSMYKINPGYIIKRAMEEVLF